MQEQVEIQTIHLAQQREQLSSQLAELKTQQIQLTDANLVKARLIAIISHDMISPLKFIVFMSKKLREAFSESDSNYRTATFIANISQDLEALSLNILNWIRFHHDSFKMVPESFNVKQMLKQSVEIAKTLADEKGLGLVVDANDSTHVTQYPQTIGVILYNLIINAIKYTDSGTIKVTAIVIDSTLHFSVADTGIGMSAELVNRLNSPDAFISEYAAADAKKYQFGYLLIKDLLRLSDGRMTVQSSPSIGTTINLEFGLKKG